MVMMMMMMTMMPMMTLMTITIIIVVVVVVVVVMAVATAAAVAILGNSVDNTTTSSSQCCPAFRGSTQSVQNLLVRTCLDLSGNLLARSNLPVHVVV